VLGKAVFAAKCSLMVWYPTNDWYYGSAYVYTLFGDPALRIKYPINTSVEEEKKIDIPPESFNQLPMIVRGALYLPSVSGSLNVLFDITGQKVMNLHPGTNDICHLAPGVYFINKQGEKVFQRIVLVD
jgi:hypothetical protein